ncbi:UBC-like protein [Hortaea werneckii]|nr:UBC-like protein [Hortaea werneckii]
MSSKNPTIKRILKEAQELAHQPSADYHAAPLESDLYEWHFTLRGPPAPSPFDGGLYHGRIVLPPAYPLKPPSFRFLTPTGRFEVNREICLTISAHHEESWQPAWGIRTALVAIRSFMDTSASGQLGGMDASEEVRKRLASQSRAWKCPACSKTNEEVMKEQEEAVEEQGDGAKTADEVPEELRLAYREDLSKNGAKTEEKTKDEAAAQKPEPAPAQSQPAQSTVAAQATSQSPQAPVPVMRQPQAQHAPRRQEEAVPAWIDKAIYGVVIALFILFYRKLVS